MNLFIAPVIVCFNALVCLSVLLSGAHAADAFGLQREDPAILHKYIGNDQIAPTKASPDLHEHVDRQAVNTVVHHASDQQLQVDHRHLRQHGTSRHVRPPRKFFADHYWLLRFSLGL